jgi:ADP-heptose:LPS heptosyltransferase
VIITGYAEQGIATRLWPLIEAVDPIVAENWPLLPTIGLLAHAAVFVGNDSGLTHLAAAFDRPTVAIFGPSDPEVWGPRGERVTIVQARGVQDAGSGQARSGSEEPWPDVAQVLHAARSWLEAADLRQSRDDRSGRS